MKKTLFAFLLVSLLSPFSVAQTSQTPTIEQSLNLKSAGGPRISPDGRYVAYQVQKTNWEDNAFETEIWIAITATGETYRLTNAKKSSSNPQWSPDSRRLAFISDRDGKRQIYLIAPNGGESIQLTNVETGVSNHSWSPDGRRIAFTAADPESKTRKDRKEKYGEYEVVQADYTFTHLWMIDVPAEIKEKRPDPARMTEGSNFSVNGFSWSPDSGRIAFSAAKDPDISSSATGDIYVLSIADKGFKRIVDTRGPDGNPVWSPDGRRIAYQTANGREFFYYANSYIAVTAADGGAPQVLTESFDESPGLIEWSVDGLYFSGLQKTSSHLFRLNPATKSIEQVSGPANYGASQFSFTSDFKQVAFVGAGANDYPEVFVSSVKTFQPKRLTTMSDQLTGFRLATREVIQWKSTDGTQIEGVLIKPAGFDPAKRYPLLVVIHGGPTGVDTPAVRGDRYYPVEMFAAKGALILRPNYRGSAGYGEKFRSLNVRNLGVGDYWDVISGVDHLIAQGIVDRDRVGAMGWSQGGYISAFITCSSDRFKAVSVGAGISDWMTYYVNTDIHPFTRQYLKATPWDDPDIYQKTSPISYVKNAKTPTLIQHGELDKRVPIPNAYQLRQALEDRGVPVKMVVYKGFGHGIDKPKQHRAVLEQNYEWFTQWIWGEKPAQEGK
ncbi:MAG TPA: S9 family peptidase [Blastocatellia bacterium]|nr:S9 family peptidase [Blastocatellia bacterium]